MTLLNYKTVVSQQTLLFNLYFVIKYTPTHIRINILMQEAKIADLKICNLKLQNSGESERAIIQLAVVNQ